MPVSLSVPTNEGVGVTRLKYEGLRVRPVVEADEIADGEVYGLVSRINLPL
jgi:hypothetical protein